MVIYTSQTFVSKILPQINLLKANKMIS